MTKPISGSCLCGGVRFAFRGKLGPAAYCHCTDCRKCTGSAFNVSVALARDDFKITNGIPKAFTKTADSGNELTRHFCADCGSPIYTSSPARPDEVFVKAGAFDDPTLIKPIKQSWGSSAVAWAHIDPDLPNDP